ncbi:MAG: methionine ABC transporter ATP-binding protein [Bacilli bacterium]
MIEIKDICKNFDNFEAVKNVNLKIEQGEILGIIGSSGAGKSTLIRIINQLEKQTSGEIIIENEILNNKNIRRKRQEIGMIFQHFNLLWSRTVRENIELPLEFTKESKTKRRKVSSNLIELVGLKGKENSYINELSGGQKQRVAIARALTNNPKLLLCDEATSALDPETSNSILNLLKEINRELNLTIILITHQMEVVQKICHRVAVMDNGEIIESGDINNIFKHPKHLITKKFIQSVNHGEIENSKENLKKLYPDKKLIRLTFTKDSGNYPILSEAILKFSLSVNIVNANLIATNETPMGIMYILVLNEEKKYQKFVEYLENKQVGVEVV